MHSANVKAVVSIVAYGKLKSMNSEGNSEFVTLHINISDVLSKEFQKKGFFSKV